jgi:hypothetical protein
MDYVICSLTVRDAGLTYESSVPITFLVYEDGTTFGFYKALSLRTIECISREMFATIQGGVLTPQMVWDTFTSGVLHNYAAGFEDIENIRICDGAEAAFIYNYIMHSIDSFRYATKEALEGLRRKLHKD